MEEKSKRWPDDKVRWSPISWAKHSPDVETARGINFYIHLIKKFTIEWLSLSTKKFRKFYLFFKGHLKKKRVFHFKSKSDEIRSRQRIPIKRNNQWNEYMLICANTISENYELKQINPWICHPFAKNHSEKTLLGLPMHGDCLSRNGSYLLCVLR